MKAPFLPAAAMLAASALTACAVGPDFHRPAAPAQAGYRVAPLPAGTAAAADVEGGDAQRFIEGQEVAFKWWEAFGSPALNALVERALVANPNVAAAQAALRQAQEMVAAQRGYFFPTVGAGYSFSRQKVAGNLSSNDPGPQGNGTVIGPSAPATPVIYNMNTAELTVGFVPDVFGANRRQVESLDAQAAVQRFQLEATYVTLVSNVVAAAIQEASVRAQIGAVRQIIADDEKQLELLRDKLGRGYATRLDVAAEEQVLAAERELLYPLDTQLTQTQNLLRVLAGKLPSEELEQSFEMSALHLPTELPLSLPSKLIRQRPDVLAAEENLRAANAGVGVAVADMLPQFNITGALGGTATEFGQMFSAGGPFWSLVGGVTQPVFQGGTLLHRKRAADAALRQAAAQYQATVLAAYQNVADTLQAMLGDAAAYAAAVEAEQAARLTLDLSRERTEGGFADLVSELIAETAYQQALLTRVQAEASRFGDTAALYQALGGGWWNRAARGS
jgi:NodT family efflux transporter outer membrane factor (OMF) lipoprotein